MYGVQLFDEMENLQREMNHLFRGLGLAPVFERETTAPRFQLTDNGESFRITATLPGIDSKKLEINVLGRQLNISGEAMAKEIPEGVKWHRQERSSGSFRQSFALPEPVDVENVLAEYVNGVLTVNLPKSADVLPKKITVKTI